MLRVSAIKDGNPLPVVVRSECCNRTLHGWPVAVYSRSIYVLGEPVRDVHCEAFGQVAARRQLAYNLSSLD